MSGWWRQLLHYALPHRRGLALAAAFMFIGVGFNLLKPWPLKLIVDDVLAGHPLPPAAAWLTALPGGATAVGLLAWLAVATVVLFLGHQAMVIAQGYVQAGVGARMAYRLGAILFEHLQRLSLRFHNRKPTGDLVRRVTTDSGCVRELIIGVLLPMITALITLIAMFVVMWRLDPLLALLALLVAPVLGVLIKVFDGPMTDRAYRHQQLEGEMMTLAERTLTALPIVQAFGREAHEDARFRGLTTRSLGAYLESILAQLQFKMGLNGTTALGAAAFMVIGGLRVLEGSLTVGGLLVLLAYLSSLYTPMETLAYLSSGFASAAARARRVFEVLETEQEVREAPGARPVPALPAGQRGHVRLERVSFGYEPDQPILHDISLEARPGQTVALAGATGAGKSTLAALIPRFFDPWEGRITFDGVDLRELRLASLRDQIALVLQEPFLLPLTVAENIAYGRPEASREAIEAAARDANAEEFILLMPQGYDTVIGERGASLSGGQRQRLAIARALIKNAPVLILDEPTAALDAHTEALLLEALERLMAGRTTFIIAHRLSTIRRADQILVLDQGRIVERGDHDTLMAAQGAYYRFHSLQFGSDRSE